MKKLYRSRTKKMLGGVCGGLGDYFKVDPTLIRIIVFIIGLFTALFPVAIAYIIAWLIIPEAPKNYKSPYYKKLYRSEKNRYVSGFCAGLAEFFKLDPTVVRLAYVAIMIVTAGVPLLVTYIFGSIITPPKPHKDDIIEIEVE